MPGLTDDPQWYKDAIIYEVQVRSFQDSNADGIGDLPGLIQRLDYLQDLGVTALWLLPFYPSPLKDDGYDISEYTTVHPDLGTLDDVRTLLREAHARGLRVITELVLNHTSDQHPWFQRARRAPAGSPERNFYVWSDTPERYPGVRIIFQDFEASNWTWDPVAQAYFWHRFYSNQPDLNFDHPPVHQALTEVVDFWFDLGVDGLRLDAVPYLYERDGTTCENLPETHDFLKALRAHVDQRFPGRMLLAEANQWPEDAVAYFGDDDECHMSFHFPLMPRLFMAVQQEDRFPIVDILDQTPPIPPSAQWAIFLRNHDELTLEMVTDQERDSMYSAYAQDPRARINLGIRRRLAPLLEGHPKKIEVMNALLFSLPGTPVLYYGDEIGMGDNVYLGDRDGVRTPMQWSADRNAGFSRANPQRLHLPVIIDPLYHYEAVNVELQQASPNSLLWWLKRLISLRKQHPAFGRGTLRVLHPQNRKVFAFLREHDDARILVVVNLSRHVQHVELDLSEFQGLTPNEILGETPLPPISDDPYPLTISGDAFYWLALQPDPSHHTPTPPTLQVPDILPAWPSLAVYRAHQDALDRALAHHARTLPRLGLGGRRVQHVATRDWIPLSATPYGFALAVLETRFEDGTHEHQLLLLGLAWSSQQPPESTLAILEAPGRRGTLYDARLDPDALNALLTPLRNDLPLPGLHGQLHATSSSIPAPNPDTRVHTPAHPSTHTVVFLGDQHVFKLFTSAEPGTHPEVELLEHLQHRNVPTPHLQARLTHTAPGHDPQTIGLLLGVVHQEGDLADYAAHDLVHTFQRARAQDLPPPPLPPSLLDALATDTHPDAAHAFGSFLPIAHALGQRLGDLHLALLDPHPDFAPEPLNALARRSRYQALRNLSRRTLQTLAEHSPTPPSPHLQLLLDARDAILRQFEPALRTPERYPRIRCHGHLHLGQALYSGKDIVFIDFEGLPQRSLAERRRKQLPLTDLSGLLASLDATSRRALAAPTIRPADRTPLTGWRHAWCAWAQHALLRAYLQRVSSSPISPPLDPHFPPLLRLHLLEQTLLELELDALAHHDPDPARIDVALDLIRGGDPLLHTT